MCLYPKLIKNRKYTSNKKNGGQVPSVTDPRVLYVPVGCQDCIECRKQKARDWQVRLLEEIKERKDGHFITLTFSNEQYTNLVKQIEIYTKGNPPKGYDLDNAVATLAIRRFLERWRKENKKSVRHWLITELGHEGTENIHIHGIIWTNKPHDIERIWGYGFVWKGTYVNERTVNYIIKYVTKLDTKHRGYKSKIHTSNGIGRRYVSSSNSKNNIFKEEKTNETYKTNSGHKISLPIYYRNKIYTDEQKEQLWLQKLNKGERWVCGEKALNIEDYLKLIEYHRQRSRRLGYGRGITTWDRIEYENQIREMLQNKRLRREV